MGFVLHRWAKKLLQNKRGNELRVHGKRIIFAGSDSYTSLAIGALLMGLLMAVPALINIMSFEEPTLGTFEKQNGTVITRTIEKGTLYVRKRFPDGRTSTSTRSYQPPTIMPLVVIVGLLFILVGAALLWLSGGSKEIDKEHRVIITSVPLLGNSIDSFDDFVHVNLKLVSYRTKHHQQHDYHVDVIGRREGNDIPLMITQCQEAAEKVAETVSEFMELPVNDERPKRPTKSRLPQ